MTKVIEGGQLEFTFDELDFEGTFQEVIAEMKLIEREIAILSKAKDNETNMGMFVKITDRIHFLSMQHSNLFDVGRLIIKYKAVI